MTARAIIASTAALLTAAATPYAKPAAVRMVTVDPVMLDDGTPTRMAVRISYPDTGVTVPLVILSHGNRLSRSDYQPLVAALVRDGYAVVQPDHGDASVDGFAPAAPQPDDVWRTRALQVRWLADYPGALAARLPALRGRIDRARIAVIGHSFGGQTAALAMGATIAEPGTGARRTYAATTVRAAVLLAPPGHDAGLTAEWKRRAPYLRLDWTTMRGPVLTVIGMEDRTPLTDQGPEWHADPYEKGPRRGDYCLIRLPGVGHYLGGIDGPLRLPAGDATPERQARVIGTTIAFLDDALGRRTAAAARWPVERREAACR